MPAANTPTFGPFSPPTLFQIPTATPYGPYSKPSNVAWNIVDFNKQQVVTEEGPPTGRSFGWGYKYVTANFKGAFFHCETSSVESGLRIVQHEFPKKMLPYAESMGHKAITWSVRAYFATYPFDSADNVLNTTDYTRGRDELARALDSNNPGWLQIHTMPPLYVQCQRWRMTESEKQGGYCTFDIEFVEYGLQPFQYTSDAYTAVQAAIDNLRQVLVAPGQPWNAQDTNTVLGPLPPELGGSPGDVLGFQVIPGQ